MAAHPIRLEIENFRALRRLDWRPEGVCVLSGANGAGKSTCLAALRFLSTLFQFGPESALSTTQGSYFRSLGTPSELPVVFRLSVGDICWTLQFPMSNEGLTGVFGEQLTQGEQVLVDASPFESQWKHGELQLLRDPRRCCIRIASDRGEEARMQPLVDALSNIHIYAGLRLDEVKQWKSEPMMETHLHSTGKNLWSVLQTWQASPRIYERRFEWVLEHARKAFPGLIDSVEFDRGLPYIFPHGSNESAERLPPFVQADGLLTGLTYLAAVAAAAAGAIVAIDEVENQLHPHAIRSILTAIRERAHEQNLTVILTTHSPVLLNQFRDEPEHIHVLGHGRTDLPNPAPLTELHDEDRLAMERLGNLYERLFFSAPDLG